jgi:DUF971 family protein
MVEAASDPTPTELRVRGGGRVLRLTFADGLTAEIATDRLRAATPSADKSAAPAGVTIVGVETIGNYAARFAFSDGHDTGLYTWKLLRELAEGAGPSNKQARETEIQPHSMLPGGLGQDFGAKSRFTASASSRSSFLSWAIRSVSAASTTRILCAIARHSWSESSCRPRLNAEYSRVSGLCPSIRRALGNAALMCSMPAENETSSFASAS